MSTFNPELPAIQRLPRDDLLARFTPTALRRPSSVAKPLRPFRLAILGVLTAGWWPCRVLQIRMQRVSLMQARQLDLSADMLTRFAPAEDVQILRSAAARAEKRSWAAYLSAACLVVSIVCAAIFLSQHYWKHTAIVDFWLRPPLPGNGLAVASVVLLCVSYLLMWIRINQDVVAIQQFAQAVNAIAVKGMAPIRVPKFVWGVRPMYLIVGFVMAWFGLFWALPMSFAWAAFVTYANDTSHDFRVELAERLQTLSGVAPVIPTEDLCANPKCRGPLAFDAKYCPRCGTEVSAAR